MKHLYAIATLFGFLLVTTGCGNIFATGIRKAPLSSLNPAQSSNSYDPFSNNTPSNYTCPSVKAVQPNHDDSSGSGYYQVCTDTGNSANILIHGKTFFQNRVCVFPAQEIDASTVFWKLDVASGGPWSICQDITNSNGNTFSFPNTNYNALFVIEEGLKEDFIDCLAKGMYSSCSAEVINYYSYGKFR